MLKDVVSKIIKKFRHAGKFVRDFSVVQMQMRLFREVIVHQNFALCLTFNKNQRVFETVRIPPVLNAPDFDLHYEATTDVLLYMFNEFCFQPHPRLYCHKIHICVILFKPGMPDSDRYHR